ncbi:MAG: energy-coupling factor ABC transporter permease [Burkholderiales bacterium]
MNIPDQLLPSAWYWIGHLLAGALLLFALRRAPLAGLAASWRLNLWLGAIVVLMVLWSIKTGVKPGLSFHVLGATALTLMFGWPLALLALALVVLGTTLAGEAPAWQALSLNFLVMGAVPVGISQAIYRVVDRHLPNHFMIYVFLCGFFGAALSMAATGLAATAVMAASGTYTLDYLSTHYLPYFVLMGWSEAILTGMAVTLMAVYRPDWVATFDDRRYLHNR